MQIASAASTVLDAQLASLRQLEAFLQPFGLKRFKKAAVAVAAAPPTPEDYSDENDENDENEMDTVAPVVAGPPRDPTPLKLNALCDDDDAPTPTYGCSCSCDVTTL